MKTVHALAWRIKSETDALAAAAQQMCGKQWENVTEAKGQEQHMVKAVHGLEWLLMPLPCGAKPDEDECSQWILIILKCEEDKSHFQTFNGSPLFPFT